jgi:hypothetical protein
VRAARCENPAKTLLEFDADRRCTSFVEWYIHHPAAG